MNPEPFKTPAVVSLPTFDLQRARSARLHVTVANSSVLTSAQLALLASSDPSFCALSPEAAAVVLRKSQARIRRKLQQSRER